MAELNRRVLIIDDDREIWRAYQAILAPESPGSDSPLSQITSLLTRHDHEATVASEPFLLSFAAQGQEGLEMVTSANARHQPFAVAFIDVRMPPGWDGMETAMRIRACDPQIEIVIATAYSDRSCEEIVRAVGDPGKILFVRKPFDPEEIRQLAVALSDKWDVARREERQRRELEEKIAALEALQREQKALQKKLIQAQKMEAIGLMAGGVAHDLNNILAGLVNYPELIRMQLPGDHPELLRYVTAIEKAGGRAAAVVADLLTVARGVAVNRQPADLNRIITEYLESPEAEQLQHLYPGIDISTHLTREPAIISCSEIHIKKCLMNLITNAAEAIAGEGNIKISTGHIPCPHRSPDAQGILLTVADNGPGIPPEAQEHIFEPFFSKKELGRSGTGLGLAVVWNCVHQHEGSIEVNSGPHGTTFAITLACTDQSLKTDHAPSPLDTQHGSGSILVVDDEEQPRDIAVTFLTMLGYSVSSVGSGEEAVEFIKNQPVDLLYLDMVMDPGINGYETFRQITALFPDQKAMLVSGFTQESEMNKARALGIKGFVGKPFTLEELGNAVRTIMDSR